MDELTIEGQELKVGTKMAWELTASELIYPFTFQVGSKSSPLFVHLKPYRAGELKQLLAETAYAVKYEDDDTSEIVKSKPEKIEAFFWKHFVRLSGHGRAIEPGDPDLEQQKQWIRDHPRFDIPQKAVVDGFGGIATKPEALPEESTNGNGDHHEEAEIDIFKMDLEMTTGIWLTQRVCLGEPGIATLDMQHNFRRETAPEYHRYERATDKQLINRKRQSYQRSVNYEVIEQLYDSLIESITGMTLKGEECAASNKDAWVKLVPFWHKHLVLTEFFTGVQSKNG